MALTAIAALGITSGAFLKAASRQQKYKALLNPRQGFYVVVPPQFSSRGGPPPTWYTGDLMRHENRLYYVGLLKAAEMHGATHQAVKNFQVITDKRLPRIRAGRSIVSLLYRKDMAQVSHALVDHKTDAGRIKISSPELTALDLLRYASVAGTIDSIATVLSDLDTKLRPGPLTKLAPAFERACTQRLGYLLDYVKQPRPAAALHNYLQTVRPLPWVELERRRTEKAAQHPIRGRRWNVIIRHKPELDE